MWVDHKICMGCKVCVNACPYGMRDTSHMVRRFDEYVRKCTFCKERRALEPDKDPYCVQTCHQKARVFGDIDDPNSAISTTASPCTDFFGKPMTRGSSCPLTIFVGVTA